jgi:hypothetical protein
VRFASERDGLDIAAGMQEELAGGEAGSAARKRTFNHVLIRFF